MIKKIVLPPSTNNAYFSIFPSCINVCFYIVLIMLQSYRKMLPRLHLIIGFRMVGGNTTHASSWWYQALLIPMICDSFLVSILLHSWFHQPTNKSFICNVSGDIQKWRNTKGRICQQISLFNFVCWFFLVTWFGLCYFGSSAYFDEFCWVYLCYIRSVMDCYVIYQFWLISYADHNNMIPNLNGILVFNMILNIHASILV